jgi:SOS-response transcriptional repressor LexA
MTNKTPLVSEVVGKNVARLRKARGMTLERLAERAGVTHSFLSRLERGKTGISSPTAAQLAVALEVPLSELSGHSDSADASVAPVATRERELSDDELSLVRAFRVVPLGERRTILSLVVHHADAVSRTKPSANLVSMADHRRAPSEEPSEWRVLQFIDAAAGLPLDAQAVPEEMEVPSRIAVGDNLALARAVGDSMTGIGIGDRDVLLVETVVATKNYSVGDIVIARINDSEYVVKRYGGHRQKKRIFLSENEAYEPLVVETARSSIEAVVLARRTTGGEWVAVPGLRR